jgi:hypothetical protein
LVSFAALVGDVVVTNAGASHINPFTGASAKLLTGPANSHAARLISRPKIVNCSTMLIHASTTLAATPVGCTWTLASVARCRSSSA